MKGQVKTRGFTFLELLVVIVIVSLISGMLVIGFDQTISRKKDTAVKEVLQWLKAATDTAIFQSTVLGVYEEAGQLGLMAFYQDDWYLLADQETLEINEEISLDWSDELVESREELLDESDESDQAPYVVIMPSGEIFPDGSILIADLDEAPVASIKWSNEEQFFIEFGAEND